MTESLRILMKREVSQESNCSQKGNHSILNYATNRSLLGKQQDISDISQRSYCTTSDNELFNTKIKSMLKNLTKPQKSKETTQTPQHSNRLQTESKRGLNTSTSSRDSATKPLPFNSFSYHFPKSNTPIQKTYIGPTQAVVLTPNPDSQSRPATKNDLYFQLTGKQGISQYLQQKRNDSHTPNYLHCLQELKKNFDKIQKQPSSAIKPQTVFSANKEPTTPRKPSQEPNYSQQSTIASSDEAAANHIQMLSLQKEEILNELLKKITKESPFTSINLYLEKYLKAVLELSKAEKILIRVDPNIPESIVQDMLCVLILSVELKRPSNQNQQIDMNLKNLVSYLVLSSQFVIEKLLEATCLKSSVETSKKMQQRLIERNRTSGRKSARSRCSLQRNNDIVNSIAQMMYHALTMGAPIYDQLEQKTVSIMKHSPKYHQARAQSSRNVSKRSQPPYEPKQFYMRTHQNPTICKNESELTFVSVASTDMMANQKPPYLKNMMGGRSYTLVLDLDETLVHYQEFEKGGGQFLVRPYAESFLTEMSKYYEIVIFTAALPDYANFILNIIDKDKVIAYKLYREHTQLKGGIHLKDLSKLGRPLTKTIIVDNLPENFQLQPENGIFIKSWVGDPSDRALKDLAPLLIGITPLKCILEIVRKKCKDVRQGLKLFREQMMHRVQSGCKDPYANLRLD